MTLSAAEIRKFRNEVRGFYRTRGRDLPWRRVTDPYRIAVSEIMLQQTQVTRVVPKYEAWLHAFPDWRSLAAASPRDVLRLWQGLGYNRRALALHRMAKAVAAEYGGVLPSDGAALRALPGIGPYTAGAILAFAFGRAVPIIETNIRRVFLHRFFEGRRAVPDRLLLELIEATLDHKDPRRWYWGLMDLGASLGRLPENPNTRSKGYRKQSPFRGSDREARGALVRLLIERPVWRKKDLLGRLGPPDRTARALGALLKEGVVREARGRIVLASI